MSDHIFISYSSADAADFAVDWRWNYSRTRPRSTSGWTRTTSTPGAIGTSRSSKGFATAGALAFVMTRDSVEDRIGVQAGMVVGLKYKKPIVPVRLQRRRRDALPTGARASTSISAVTLTWRSPSYRSIWCG